MNPFVWHEGDTKLTGLGTLKADNSGLGVALRVSADGRVVVGTAASDSSAQQAFIWREGDSKVIGLGSLRADNSGRSQVLDVSSDGRVVVGESQTDDTNSQAFVWYEGDTKVTGLGTLRSDNLGFSQPTKISADGRVVAGWASMNSSEYNAFVWHEGDTKMTGLGTLRADNSGDSLAVTLSADGSVAAGMAETDSGMPHAVLWKIRWSDTPVVNVVDVDNSRQAMLNTATKAQKVLGLYQGAQDTLSSTRCQIGGADYCVGVFSQYQHTAGNDLNASGLYGAIRLLPDARLTAGVSVSVASPVRMSDGYDARGNKLPGVGLFTRWQASPDGVGLSAELSGAMVQQDVTIRREQLIHTEPGKGDASVKGWQARAGVSWGGKATDSTLVTPLMAVTYQSVSRSAYTENQGADFPASYGQMRNQSTSLRSGVAVSHQVASSVTLTGEAGADWNLSRQRNAFSGRIDYIGAFAYDTGRQQNVRPYTTAGINVEPGKNHVIRVSAGWQQTDYRANNVQAGLEYAYRW